MDDGGFSRREGRADMVTNADLPDVRVQLDGPHAVFYLESEAAEDWWERNVEGASCWCGGWFVPGPHSVMIFDALVDEGFVVATC